jgi:hypothetical protein
VIEAADGFSELSSHEGESVLDAVAMLVKGRSFEAVLRRTEYPLELNRPSEALPQEEQGLHSPFLIFADYGRVKADLSEVEA